MRFHFFGHIRTFGFDNEPTSRYTTAVSAEETSFQMDFMTHNTFGSMRAGFPSAGDVVALAGVADATSAVGARVEGVCKPWPCASASSASLDGDEGRNQLLASIPAGSHGTQDAHEHERQKGFSEEVAGHA